MAEPPDRRRSDRATKGQPPVRYGSWVETESLAPSTAQRRVVRFGAESASERSDTTSGSSTSQERRTTRLILQAKLQAEQELAEQEMELLRRTFEASKRLTELRLAVKEAEILEETDSVSDRSSTLARPASLDSLLQPVKAASVSSELPESVPLHSGLCPLDVKLDLASGRAVNVDNKPPESVHPHADLTRAGVELEDDANVFKPIPKPRRIRREPSRDQWEQQNLEFRVKEEAYQRRLWQLETEAARLRRLHRQPGKESGDLQKFVARQSMGKDLPTFDGKPEDWPTFVSAYETSSEECQFTDNENRARLMKALKGRAKDAVQGILSLPHNATRAVKLLERRYGRPEVIVQALIDKAKRVPPIREGHLEALVDLADATNNLAATMQHLDATGHMCNPQLRKELVDKLPPSLRLQWGEHIRSTPVPEETTLKTLANWLDARADAACQVWTPGEHKVSSRAERVYAASETRSTSSRSKDRCAFCQKTSHTAPTCNALHELPVQERWSWVKREKLCFCCLRPGHAVKECRSRVACNENGCSSHHHKILHRLKAEGLGHPPQQEHAEEPAFSGHAQSSASTSAVLLRILPVRVSGPGGEVDTYALLDEGSTTSLLDEDLARRVGAEGEISPLTMRWTDTTERRYPSSRRVTVSVGGDCDSQLFALSARTVERLDLPVQTVPRKKLASWSHLNDARVKPLVNAKPTLLIGQDHSHLTVAREVVEGPPNAPMLTRTKLGWVVHGRVGRPDRIDPEFTYHAWIRDDPGYDALHQLVEDAYRTEAFGTQTKQEHHLRSRDDQQAMQIMERTTRRVGNNRWETGLLWKAKYPALPSSKAAALNRLYSLERKLDRSPELAEQYEKKMTEYLSQGFASPVPASDNNSPVTWYLPHFAAINPNKPGKLRLVFDAAAKCNGTSLNDHLLPGPDLLNPLTSVLFKFRQRRIGFGGDIRSMFHMVQIQPSDRTAQRFLWRGKDCTNQPTEYQMDVMTFGATCSPASAQYVMRRNAKELSKAFPEAEIAIRKHHYMDDYFDSTDSEEEAARRIRDVTHVHARGGFEIRNWVSNSQRVLPSATETVAAVDINGQTHNIEKTLGLRWDTESDDFVFVLSPRLKSFIEKLQPDQLTKRHALRLIMSLFDPMGMIACATVGGRILLQHVWRSGIGWDDALPASLRERWNAWWAKVQDVQRLRIPRCYTQSVAAARVRKYQLHTFCDASEEAFAAVCYLRYTLDDDQVLTSHVAAKMRVAPLKPITIPRLELQAAVLGSRLATMVQEEHDVEIDELVYWTDSRTVLHWLRADARQFKPFVAHRVGEVSELTNISQWRWVPTLSNPADAATREKCVVSPLDTLWLHGPAFLRESEEEWPAESSNPGNDPDVECQTELKKEFVNVVTANDSRDRTAALPSIDRFSSWSKLVRTTARVLMFTRLLKERVRNPRRRWRTSPVLLLSEVREAQRLWMLKSQADSFPAEISALRSDKPLERSSRLLTLSPTIEDGLLKVAGRTDNASCMSSAAKSPVILDPEHPYTCLLLMQYHRWNGHHGRERMLNDMRQRFWILQMRSAVKKTWTNCQQCKVKRASPATPEMGQLPSARLAARARPFTHTGVDYFGPSEVTVGRRKEKRYGVIFTCLTIRAVHLEIANSLTTDSCIMAIRRFIARRGYPAAMYSDNGTNFHGAHRELRRALQDLDHEHLAAELLTKEIEWHFNPPAAPHMGGAWERLVRSVKVALNAALKERSPREEVLATVFAEAEHLVNSRPLTHVSVDPTDPESLTPNHFLLGESQAVTCPGVFDNADLHLRKSWRTAQAITDMYWRRWVREYLPQLTRRTRWHRNQPNLQVGDVAVIIDEKMPRGSWPMGTITATHPGKDGVVRVVDIRTKDAVYRRPATKIAKLDVE